MAESLYGQLSLKWLLGWNGKTVDFVTDNVLCYVCGNHILFINAETTQYTEVFSSPGVGIQAFGTSVVENFFAFSEISYRPKIFVYKYPSLEKVCELRDGAEQEVQAISFSWEDHLGCISGLPHFKITIWKWSTTQKLCSVKVGPTILPRLYFNPCNWRQLCSMERGQLTLWDVFHDEKDFMLSPRHMRVPQPDLKRKNEPSPYVGLKLPEFGFNPPNKYILKFLQKEPKDMSEPTAAQWLPSGDVLVCTADGEVWKPKYGDSVNERTKPTGAFAWHDTVGLINIERGDITLLWNESYAFKFGAALPSELPFISMALHRTGLFLGTNNGFLLKLQLMPTFAKVTGFQQLPSGIVRLRFPLNHSSLVIGCKDQSVYLHPPTGDIKDPLKMLLFKRRKYVAADILPSAAKYILALDEANVINTIHFETMETVSFLKLPAECCTVTCSSLWYGAVVGTVDGSIYVLEYAKHPTPRLIHTIRLDDGPITSVKFDPSGCVMFVLCGKLRIFFLSGRPSLGFAVFGYIDLHGTVVDMTSWNDSYGDAHFVFLNKEGREDLPGGTVFTKIQLPKTLQPASAKNFANADGSLIDEFILRKSWCTANACVGLAPDSVENILYTYIIPLKMVLKFSLLDMDQLSYESPVDVELVEGQPVSPDVPATPAQTPSDTPESTSPRKLELPMMYPKIEVLSLSKGIHDLADVTLLSNTSLNLVVTYGNDGKLACRPMENLDEVAVAHAESYVVGERGQATIARNGQFILIVSKSGNLMLYYWSWAKTQLDIAQKQRSVVSYKEQYPDTTRENMAARLKPAGLAGVTMLETGPMDKPPVPAFSLESSGIRTPPSPPRSPPKISEELVEMVTPEMSWIKLKLKQKRQVEAEACATEIQQIRRSVKELGYELAKVLVENDLLPEGEELSRQEFELDTEMQHQLQAETEEKLQKIREETIRQNLLHQCKWDMIKRECWDPMFVKGRSIKAFLDDTEVENFALKARTEEELNNLKFMEVKRQIEMHDFKLRKALNQADETYSRPLESLNPDIRTFHLGSQGLLYGGDNPAFYSQFELFTRDQKHCQIALVKDAIYRIKLQFNKEFDELYRKKMLAVFKIRERNTRLTQIMDDISMPGSVFTPVWSSEEQPERFLTVEEHEIKVEKWISPEERAILERKHKEEEEIRRRKNADDFRRRAVMSMMGGVLQVRREDEVFKKDVPVPPFLEKKPTVAQWNEEEYAQYREYERKVKELNEERDKLRKQLEAEFNRLKENAMEVAEAFDVEVHDLFLKKMQVVNVVTHEELKLCTLNMSLAIDESVQNQHEFLLGRIQKLQAKKVTLQDDIAEIQRKLHGANEVYETMATEDKAQEKQFKREFGDLPPVAFEALQKLFRRRPRVQRTLPGNICQPQGIVTDNPFGEGPFGTALIAQNTTVYEAALAELDNIAFKPEALTSSYMWEQFCKFRRNKIQLEQKMKERSSKVADLATYLQLKQSDRERTTKEISDVKDSISRLLGDYQRLTMNLDIQLVLKQGQVEMETEGVLQNFNEALFINRTVVEDKNNQIKALGTVKVDGMIENLNLESMIVMQEWEHRRMEMTLEDLVNSAKEIQRMQVTREIMDYLRNRDNLQRHAEQIVKIEETATFSKMAHAKKKHEKSVAVNKTKRMHVLLKNRTKALEDQMKDINSMISGWTQIPKMDEPVGMLAVKKFEDLSHRRELAEKARMNTITLLELHREVNELLERTVPILDKPQGFVPQPEPLY